jgi:hypothetical protein
MARQKTGKRTAAAARAAQEAKKKARMEKVVPAPVRGRVRMVRDEFLSNVTEDRVEVNKTIEENTGEHMFVSVVKRYGYPKTSAFNCADCQFQRQYDPFLYADATELKQRQTHQICLQCSYHWRGPSLYYVCHECSKDREEGAEGNDVDFANQHCEIFAKDEPTIDRRLLSQKKLSNK